MHGALPVCELTIGKQRFVLHYNRERDGLCNVLLPSHYRRSET